MKKMMQKGSRLGALGNIHIILLFTATSVIMEVNLLMEVTFVECEVHLNNFS